MGACDDGSRATAAETSADLVVLPGLGMTTERDIRVRLGEPDALCAAQALQAAAAGGGACIATSCSGGFLLAMSGLLDGRRATTSWWLAPLFAQMHPQVRLRSDEIVVSDGPCHTAGAAIAQLDLMLTLIARHAGAVLADQCARYLAFGPRRSQSPYIAAGLLAAADDDVRQSRSWALEHLQDGVGVGELAAAASMSTRTYARRVHDATGMSPERFLRRVRVERAVELLEATTLPAEQVARAVGYADASALRRAMRQELGNGPRAVRSFARAIRPDASSAPR